MWVVPVVLVVLGVLVVQAEMLGLVVLASLRNVVWLVVLVGRRRRRPT